MSYADVGMRCPTCGTENVPDSRFCGACGAKLTPAESRVAPTAKIPDDAPFPSHYGSQSPQSYAPYQSVAPTAPASTPPQNHYQSGPASIPPNTYQAPNYQSGPASIPPNTYQAPASLGFGAKPASIPPQNQLYGRVQSVPAAHEPSEPSMSMPAVPGTRWGLIVLVLLLDVGLAAAGVVMLQKGLAKPDAAEAGSAMPVAPAPAATPKATNEPAASPAVAASLVAVASSAAPATADPAKSDVTKTSPGRPKPASPIVAQTKASAPEDPYDTTTSLRAEIELEVSRSQSDIDKCRDEAGTDVHGRVDVRFRVQLDGRVDTLKILENTTHIASLATCLQTVVSHWTFASHPAQPSDFVRPFIY